MQNRGRIAIRLSAIIFAVGASGQAIPAPGNPIDAMILEGVEGESKLFLASLEMQGGTYNPDRIGEVAEAARKLDKAAPAAIRYAGKNADLVHAIKDYYAAESAYLGNGVPTDRIQKIQSDNLKSAAEAKYKALELEMTLSKKK